MWENVLFILLHVVVLFFQYRYWRDYLFPMVYFCCLSYILVEHFCVDLFLGSFILFHTMEYYSAIKTDEVMIHAKQSWKHYAMWKKPEKRLHIIWLHLYEMSRMSKSMETVNKLVVQGWEEVGMGGWLLMRTGFLSEMMEMLWNWIAGVGVRPSTILKTTSLYNLRG